MSGRLVVAGLALLLVGSAGRPNAVFWSTATGKIEVWQIGGNTVTPFTDPPSRLHLVLKRPSDAAVFRRLVLAHTRISRAVINDAGDGEYYDLRGVRVTGHSTVPYGTAHPGITLTIEEAHVRCGPPTCLTPMSD